MNNYYITAIKNVIEHKTARGATPEQLVSYLTHLRDEVWHMHDGYGAAINALIDEVNSKTRGGKQMTNIQKAKMLLTENMQETRTLISAIRTLLKAEKECEDIRAIVEPAELRILLDGKYQYDDEPFGIITKLKDAYRMSDSDFNDFAGKCYREYAVLGIQPEIEGTSPLLIAKHNILKQKHNVLDAAEYITGLKSEDIYMLKQRDEMILLLKKALVCYEEIADIDEMIAARIE